MATKHHQTWEEYKAKQAEEGLSRPAATGSDVHQTWEQFKAKQAEEGHARPAATGGVVHQTWEQFKAKQAEEGQGATPTAQLSPPIAAATSAPVAQAGAPAVGKVLRSLIVHPGAKDALRGQLTAALAGIAAFALQFFDALVTEQGAESANSSQPAPPSPSISAKPAWEQLGFGVQASDGALVVSHVLGDSPAGRAGLQVGDKIVQVEDLSPRTLEQLEMAIAKGSKWAFYRLHLERNGLALPVSMTKE